MGAIVFNLVAVRASAKYYTMDTDTNHNGSNDPNNMACISLVTSIAGPDDQLTPPRQSQLQIKKF
jgi:hypothetical protein